MGHPNEGLPLRQGGDPADPRVLHGVPPLDAQAPVARQGLAEDGPHLALDTELVARSRMLARAADRRLKLDARISGPPPAPGEGCLTLTLGKLWAVLAWTGRRAAGPEHATRRVTASTMACR